MCKKEQKQSQESSACWVYGASEKEPELAHQLEFCLLIDRRTLGHSGSGNSWQHFKCAARTFRYDLRKVIKSLCICYQERTSFMERSFQGSALCPVQQLLASIRGLREGWFVSADLDEGLAVLCLSVLLPLFVVL